MDRRENELQSTCLDVNAFFGLFVVVAIWSVCDLLIKFGYLAKQCYRCIRQERSRKYTVETGVNSTLSTDYVTGATSIPLRPVTSTPRPLRPEILPPCPPRPGIVIFNSMLSTHVLKLLFLRLFHI